MKAIIRNATILCTASPFHKTCQDLFIDDGFIRQIGQSLQVDADLEIAQDGIHVSVGWIDTFAHFCEPGFEHRETLVSGANAAMAGGFTEVMCIPDTQPVMDSKSLVHFLKEKSKQLPVTLYPIAAVSKHLEGVELSEMYDLHNSGAIAFSNGLKGLQDPGITLKSLQYLLAIDGVLIQVPGINNIAPHALMNEGVSSTQLGLPGKPALAEELMVHRDIQLAAYTQSRLHLTGVSTAVSIQLIKEAKEKGLKVSCGVTPFHLFFCDEDLAEYDTNLKVNPPLRTRRDVAALQQALEEGIIDVVSSHHLPQHADDKDCEFEYAKNGMISLQNVFGILSPLLPLEDTIQIITDKARDLFNIPKPIIDTGAKANLTMFLPNESYIFEKKMIRSLCANSPFVGKSMKGKIIGTIHNNMINLVNYD